MLTDPNHLCHTCTPLSAGSVDSDVSVFPPSLKLHQCLRLKSFLVQVFWREPEVNLCFKLLILGHIFSRTALIA